MIEPILHNNGQMTFLDVVLKLIDLASESATEGFGPWPNPSVKR
ncbi:hypothetical protein BH10CHL1_BH10CHL1_17730 [soil metagenome]